MHGQGLAHSALDATRAKPMQKPQTITTIHVIQKPCMYHTETILYRIIVLPHAALVGVVDEHLLLLGVAICLTLLVQCGLACFLRPYLSDTAS